MVTATTQSAHNYIRENLVHLVKNINCPGQYNFFLLTLKSLKQPLFYSIPNHGGDVYFGFLIRTTSFAHLTSSDAQIS